jgi:hypothetical protein
MIRFRGWRRAASGSARVDGASHHKLRRVGPRRAASRRGGGQAAQRESFRRTLNHRSTSPRELSLSLVALFLAMDLHTSLNVFMAAAPSFTYILMRLRQGTLVCSAMPLKSALEPSSNRRVVVPFSRDAQGLLPAPLKSHCIRRSSPRVTRTIPGTGTLASPFPPQDPNTSDTNAADSGR